MSKGTKKKKDSDVLQLDKDALLQCYYDMVHIRRFEEKAGQLYGMGLIGGFCHLYIGQEAVVVGLQACVAEGDGVVTSYRDHGHMLAAGTDPGPVFAELMGRVDGVSRGKGGSMHMFDIPNHFYGGHGIVGAQVPIGTGVAFSHKYRDNGNLCLTYLGDGAVNQGQVYESFNMAALWELPCIYVIENNEYAMGTSVSRATANTELYRRGEPFGIPGVQVNGMDVLEVMQAGRDAVAHVRSGKGPIILEMKTYRYRGHSMSDPAKYRSKEEVTNVKETRDPIEGFKAYLLDKSVCDEAELKALDKQIKERVAAAVEFAKDSPEPDAFELYTDVLNEE